MGYPVGTAIRSFGPGHLAISQPGGSSLSLNLVMAGRRSSVNVAGGPGFEPRLSESESEVLPLNYPPPRCSGRHQNTYQPGMSRAMVCPDMRYMRLSHRADYGPYMAM